MSTFRDLLEDARRLKRETDPVKAFYNEVAEVTKKSVSTVKLWACGHQYPDDLTTEVLEKHFKVGAGQLFPERESKKDKKVN